MTEKRLLEVGDIVYSKHFDNWTSRFKIDRVTAKFAFEKESKYEREIFGQALVTPVPYDKWQTVSFFIETPEIKVEFENQRILSKLSRFDYSVLTPEQRRRILNIINEGV